MKVNVRLNKDVTEEDFLIATFDNAEFELGSYNIAKMKTTTLNGEIGDGDLNVEVLRRNGDTIKFYYSNEMKLIWDSVDDLDEAQ